MKIVYPDGYIRSAYQKTNPIHAGINFELHGMDLDGKARYCSIEMTAHEAIRLAISLIHNVNKHTDMLKSDTSAALKRLSKKYAK